MNGGLFNLRVNESSNGKFKRNGWCKYDCWRVCLNGWWWCGVNCF